MRKNLYRVILVKKTDGTIVCSSAGTDVQRIRIDNACACARIIIRIVIDIVICFLNVFCVNLTFLSTSVDRTAYLVPGAFLTENLYRFILTDDTQNCISCTSAGTDV